MTEDERTFARVLHGARIFASTTKRFASLMAAIANEERPEITEKQGIFLRAAVHTFRRQIAPETVALAQEQLRLMKLAKVARQNGGFE